METLGAVGVSVDMLKAGGEIIVRTLTVICEGIREEEEIPSDWKTGLTVTSPHHDCITNRWPNSPISGPR